MTPTQERELSNGLADLTVAFETETCSRCGGSGRYSFCQMYGDMCFKCSGKGKVYTMRAMAALAYGRELRTVKTSEVQIGWLLYEMASPLGGKAGWHVVTNSALSNCTWRTQDGKEGSYWLLETSEGGLNTFPESPVQAVPNRERLAEVKALSLAYQATLTKAGKVAKRKAVAA